MIPLLTTLALVAIATGYTYAAWRVDHPKRSASPLIRWLDFHGGLQ